jgi:hypothetical protein
MVSFKVTLDKDCVQQVDAVACNDESRGLAALQRQNQIKKMGKGRRRRIE